MAIKEINRLAQKDQICKCGKESFIHSTEYPDEETCVHHYFCNACWWEYEKKPRLMADWQIRNKQKDIHEWRMRVYGGIH